LLLPLGPATADKSSAAFSTVDKSNAALDSILPGGDAACREADSGPSGSAVVVTAGGLSSETVAAAALADGVSGPARLLNVAGSRNRKE
jgi:hypothetical protein